MSLFSELRRRNVFKIALLYSLFSLLIHWLVGGPATALGAPGWANEFVLLVLAIGFPVALIFAWTYEVTPQGLKKSLDVDQTQSIVYKTGQKLNAAVAVLAVLGLMALFGERLMPTFEFPVIVEPEEAEPLYDWPERADVPQDISSYTLDNGLRIIVWPDHDMPDVVMYNYVRAGGRDEYPGITGLAHFFEHMMFNGTARHAQGEFSEAVEAAGGVSNAYTSKDVTIYQDRFPRSALETIFELEADRLTSLAIDPDVVAAERAIIYAERQLQVDNDSFGHLYEQMLATAFVAHPYQFPVIGWPSDIENWTQRALESYFRIYYAPNNLTMVFAGDITAKEIFALADEHFGPMTAVDPPQRIRTAEPEQRGERHVAVEMDAPTPLLHMAFQAGSATDTETQPLNLLLHVLASGTSSRLHRALVRDEPLALSVGAFQMEGFDPGLAYFYLTLARGADVDAVEARMLEELHRIAAEGVTADELARARNIMLSVFWRGLDTIDGKASALGEADVFLGDYKRAFALPSELAAIAASDLQDVAASTFQRNKMTVGILRLPVLDGEK